jgi:hypothetical protein
MEDGSERVEGWVEGGKVRNGTWTHSKRPGARTVEECKPLKGPFSKDDREGGNNGSELTNGRKV